MEASREDCKRCNSAGSIEHGMCQVCLADQPLPARVIHLPVDEFTAQTPLNVSPITRPRVLA